MTTSHIYLSTTIPYVNARAHIGHALELVQADVLARHHRRLGEQVRFQSGTDDNSLKNVLAAEAAGCSTQELVTVNGRAFAELAGPLALSWDDFIHTSTDPRHRPGVERLWRACAERGDLYLRDYEGLYCVGCEQFYRPSELDDGRCPEHGTRPDVVAERNWFFRLSRYAGELRELIESDRLRIQPAARRNEVLGFLASGLADISISRSVDRARGWGIPVPGDPGQVIYVWWDALGNYITALGYGTGSDDYQRWWAGADRRVHLVGKGVLRFHAVYWPAILLSAGEPLPTEIVVHDYLTAGGRKISKSSGADLADPVAVAGEYGTDAVRWWLLREVPRVGDADFTIERLVDRANRDLANGLGNLVNRVTTLAHAAGQPAPPAAQDAQSCDGPAPEASAPPTGTSPPSAEAGTPSAEAGESAAVADAAVALEEAVAAASGLVAAALDDADFRAAIGAVWRIVDAANRYAEEAEPWRLAKAARAGDREAAGPLAEVLGRLLRACRALAAELTPFAPGLAARVGAAIGARPGEPVPAPAGPLFPRLTVSAPLAAGPPPASPAPF